MISKSKTLLLSKKDVIDIINQIGINKVMDDLIDRLDKEVSQFDPLKIQIPIRSGFNYSLPATGLVEWMPVYQQGKDVVIKLVGYHPNNPKDYNLPTIISTISTYDTSTGHLKALIDGVLLTALRTGASSAIASRAMASESSSRLGLIGCGAQAITQLHALSRIYTFDSVKIYDVDHSTMESFQRRIDALDLDCTIEFSTIDDIISTSDIVCTATSKDVNSDPLFENQESLPHIHINAVGSDFPGKVELPLSFLKESKLIPDFLPQALIEGECQQVDPSTIFDDWVKILREPKKYQNLQYQRTVFDSTGWALEDLVVSNLFIEYAAKLGLGDYLEIENLSTDVKNPYDSIENKVSSRNLASEAINIPS